MKKIRLNVVILIILLVAIPLSIYLIRNPQILRSRATGGPSILQFLGQNGQVVSGTTTSSTVGLRLTYAQSTLLDCRTDARLSGSCVLICQYTGPAPCNPVRAPDTDEACQRAVRAAVIPPGCGPPTATSYRVFVTSTAYNGDLKTAGSAKGLGTVSTGLDGADKICQSHANAASLGGTWKAWLSNSAVNAKDRLGSYNGVYKLVDGTTVVNSQAELLGGSLQTPIKKDENGRDISAEQNQHVWTNTQTTGLNLPSPASTPGFWEGVPQQTLNGAACQGWTIADYGSPYFKLTGGIGRANQATGAWTQFGRVSDSLDGRAFDCNNQARLYCFETGTGSNQGAGYQSAAGGATPPPGSVNCTEGETCESSCLTSDGRTCGSGTKVCRYTTGSRGCFSGYTHTKPCTLPACSAAPAPASTPSCKIYGDTCTTNSQCCGNSCTGSGYTIGGIQYKTCR